MKKYLSFHLGKRLCRELENGHLAIETNIKELYITEKTTPFQVLLPSAGQMKKNRCLCFSTEQNSIFIMLNPSGGVSLTPRGLWWIFNHPATSYVGESFISIAVYHIKIVDRKSFLCPFTILCQKWDFSFFVRKMSRYSF